MLLTIFLSCCLTISMTDAVGMTRMCYECSEVADPTHCTRIASCHREHNCFTRVDFLHGKYVFTKGCAHECETGGLIGKRNGPHGHGDTACTTCCHSSLCNTHGCEKYTPTASTTHTVPTTTRAQPLPLCRDHELDGFQCSDYSQFNFCTDTTSFAHKLAIEQCPHFCGFCDAHGNFKVTHAPVHVDASTTTVLIPSSPAPAPSTTAGILTATIVIGATEAPFVCEDKEDASFSCTQWSSYGFCVDNGGTGYTIAVERCSKHCGFCT